MSAMNKIHKTVWNAVSGSWVATSELTKTQGKSNQLNSLLKSAIGLALFSGLGSAAYAAECNINEQGHWHIGGGQCTIDGQTHNTQLGTETGLHLDNSTVEVNGNGNLTINATTQNSNQSRYSANGVQLTNNSQLSLNDLTVNIKPGEQHKTSTGSGVIVDGGSSLNANNVNVNAVYAGESPNISDYGPAISYGLYVNGNNAAKETQVTVSKDVNIDITNTADSEAGQFGLAPLCWPVFA